MCIRLLSTWLNRLFERRKKKKKCKINAQFQSLQQIRYDKQFDNIADYHVLCNKKPKIMRYILRFSVF